MVVVQTGSQMEVEHILAYLHPRLLASILPDYYFHEQQNRLQVFKVDEVEGMVN